MEKSKTAEPPKTKTLKQYVEGEVLPFVSPSEYEFLINMALSFLTEFTKGKIYETLSDQSMCFGAVFGAYGVGKLTITSKLEIPSEINQWFEQFMLNQPLDARCSQVMQKNLKDIQQSMSALPKKKS